MEQTNQYIKQFPELMKGKKILYVHGFGSSGQSGTVTRIREVLPNTTVVAPDLPIEPEEAMALLRQVCDKEHPDLIIGTSMGGMYAEMLRGFDRIIVNPALEMGETMKAHGMMGAQHFSNPRLDGVQDFIVTKTLVKAYKDMTEHCFKGLDDEDLQRVWGLHRMNDQSFMHAVVPVIRWIDDHQEGRERPIVYIDVNTLIDKWGKSQSSAQKTVRTLLETYQLFFVAPAPAEPQHYADINQWLYEYINVPAYGHTVFTNQKTLLYGDYLIDAEQTEGMGALIRFGSDTFKTWDDIADYFSRLGGQ